MRLRRHVTTSLSPVPLRRGLVCATTFNREHSARARYVASDNLRLYTDSPCSVRTCSRLLGIRSLQAKAARIQYARESAVIVNDSQASVSVEHGPNQTRSDYTVKHFKHRRGKQRLCLEPLLIGTCLPRGCLACSCPTHRARPANNAVMFGRDSTTLPPPH